MTPGATAWPTHDRDALALLHLMDCDAPRVTRGATTSAIDDGIAYVEALAHRWELGPPRVRLIGADRADAGSAFRPWTHADGSIAFRAPEAGLLDLLEQNRCTLALNRWHLLDESCLGVVQQVTARRGTEAMGNLYLATRRSRSFGPHWDGHDVLVVQLTGRKSWRFFGCEIEDATRALPQGSAPANTVYEVELAPGDALLVPRGWWHDTTCTSLDASLHVSIAGYPFTAAMVLERLLSKLEPEQRALRRQALMTSPSGTEVDTAVVLAALAQLQTALTSDDPTTRSEG